jgi:hypothetical protein
LSRSLREQGKLLQAEKVAIEALAMLRVLHGEDSYEIAQAYEAYLSKGARYRTIHRPLKLYESDAPYHEAK